EPDRPEHGDLALAARVDVDLAMHGPQREVPDGDNARKSEGRKHRAFRQQFRHTRALRPASIVQQRKEGRPLLSAPDAPVNRAARTVAAPVTARAPGTGRRPVPPATSVLTCSAMSPGPSTKVALEPCRTSRSNSSSFRRARTGFSASSRAVLAWLRAAAVSSR